MVARLRWAGAHNKSPYLQCRCNQLSPHGTCHLKPTSSNVSALIAECSSLFSVFLLFFTAKNKKTENSWILFFGQKKFKKCIFLVPKTKNKTKFGRSLPLVIKSPVQCKLDWNIVTGFRRQYKPLVQSVCTWPWCWSYRLLRLPWILHRCCRRQWVSW